MTVSVDDIAKIAGMLTLLAGVWWALRKDIDLGRRELDAFKLHVAERYASRDSMVEALKPLLEELHALRDRIDKLIDRP